MEEALDHDHDEVVQTCGSLTKLEEIVLANATGISKLMTIMRENVSTVAVLQSIVDETSIQVKTMAEALREVTEMANNAFRLASGAQPTIIGHGVKLDALVDDVSKMSSDIGGLFWCHMHLHQITLPNWHSWKGLSLALIRNLLHFENY